MHQGRAVAKDICVGLHKCCGTSVPYFRSRRTGVDADLSPTTSDHYKTPAIRPKYSVLENARLKELGLDEMRSWREALAAYLK